MFNNIPFQSAPIVNALNISPAHSTSSSGPVIAGFKNRVLPSQIDLIGNIDGTESSAGFSAGIIQINTDVARNLTKLHSNVLFGLHVCRDREYDKDYDFSLGMGMSADEFILNLSRIVFEGGGDAEESQFDSMLTIGDTYPCSFSGECRRAIVLESSSSSKPTADGLNGADVASTLKKLGFVVMVIAPNGVNLHELAVGTGGYSFELSNTPKQADIDRVTDMLTKSMTRMNTNGGTVGLNNTNFGSRGTQRVLSI